MTPLPPGKHFDWSNLAIRAASALVLVPAAVGAVWWGGLPFLLLISVGVALLSIEWSGMSAPRAPLRVLSVVLVSVLAGVFLIYLLYVPLAWASLALGAAIAALIARRVAERPADAAFGVVYIGIPCLALVWLRGTPEGALWVLMLFAVTWSADIAAFLVGSLLKGPKLWPRFSPNKTWSGFVGGLAASTATGALCSALFGVGMGPVTGAVIGFMGGLATMGGDLWESMLKRRFGVKDSGDLIPGHGGLLDRVDGLMFAVLVLAIARLAELFR
ncbi:phosphatidate cytidylyltransferase [Phenylobacterium sp.]|uniref:phosphatidate cytidylyltransferase n=1 Tax=Phenylobacterium sp. TaxID=1871053 RepID=UPI0027302461|nr:phosphatidate cytidylyltransferase [Phenylobacterium sp.]MDP1874750.1 phosphatidate cytidylyltransferase [Phenylobacterium sp.]